MHLLLIRHAIAEDRIAFARTGESDFFRPLTDKGRSRMQLGAAGLRAVVPEIGVLATSPLTRAVETAEIIAEEYGLDPEDIERVEALGSGDGEALLAWLNERRARGPVAIVGHEPFFSDWTSWFLAGDGPSFVVVKKGSAILLEFPTGVAPGEAVLHWALTPAQLRLLAE